MPVYSMTGYASVQHGTAAPASEAPVPPTDTGPLGLEIRSVNGRFLDLSFRLPEEARGLEPQLRDILSGRLKRGKVEVRVLYDSSASETLREPSTRQLQRLSAMQDSVRAWLPTAAPLSVAEVLRISSGESGASRDWSALLPPLAERAVQALLQARQREGERLAATLLERIALLRDLARQASPLVPQLVEQQRLRFLERWREAMALTDGATLPAMAEERALTEATAFAIRIDVAEEITRLNSHLDELERLITRGGEIGKRLDFLIQELHREANTLGSKSAALELTHISVDMKVLIEQMREQVQNIE